MNFYTYKTVSNFNSLHKTIIFYFLKKNIPSTQAMSISSIKNIQIPNTIKNFFNKKRLKKMASPIISLLPHIIRNSGTLFKGAPYAMGVYQIYKTVKDFAIMDKKSQANDIVMNHVYWSLGAGVIPIPILDIAAVTATQVDMLRQLANLYEVRFLEDQGKVLVTGLAGGAVARIAGSLIKAIPLVGTILGVVSMPAMSAASTYAIGHVFIRHFENGGTLANFEPTAFAGMYDELFEKGRKLATEAEKNKKNNATPEAQHAVKNPADASDNSLVARLQQLSNLKEKGIITEAEFKALKEKLIGSL